MRKDVARATRCRTLVRRAKTTAAGLACGAAPVVLAVGPAVPVGAGASVPAARAPHALDAASLQAVGELLVRLLTLQIVGARNVARRRRASERQQEREDEGRSRVELLHAWRMQQLPSHARPARDGARASARGHEPCIAGGPPQVAPQAPCAGPPPPPARRGGRGGWGGPPGGGRGGRPPPPGARRPHPAARGRRLGLGSRLRRGNMPAGVPRGSPVWRRDEQLGLRDRMHRGAVRRRSGDVPAVRGVGSPPPADRAGLRAAAHRLLPVSPLAGRPR